MKFKQKKINIIWFGVLASMVAIASPWFDLSVSNHSFVKTYFAGIGSGLLFLLAIWYNHKNIEINWHISWIKLPLLLVFSMGTLSILWSVNADLSITKWMIWFTIFTSFIAAYNINLTYENLIKFCWGLLIAALIIASIGILQYLFDPFTLTQAAVPSATFGNKNMATQPLTLIMPLLLFLLFSPLTQDKKAWIVTISIALILTFVLYTTTRGSWIAISGEILLISIFLLIKRKNIKNIISWNKNKTYASIFALSLFLLMINFSANGWNPYWDTISSTIQAVGGSAANDDSMRYHLFAAANHMIADSPLFGTGLGSWFHNEVQGSYGTYKVQYLQRVHNDILEMGVEIGLVGVLIFLTSIVAIIVAIWKILSKEKEGISLFYFLLLTALAGSFINMQFSFPYQLAMPSMLFGFYVGMIAKKSEEFINPIKELKFNFNKTSVILYKRILLLFSIILMVVVSSIYISWANSYSTLNKINSTGRFNNLHLIDTPIHHLEMPNILNFLSSAYLGSGKNKIALIAVNKSLEYWDHDEITWYKKAIILMNLGRHQQALLAIQNVKKYANYGSYRGNILALQIYTKLSNKALFIKEFNEMHSQDEKTLALDSNTYRSLLANALSYPELYKFAPKAYEKYNKYHNYNCANENNIAVYYLRIKDYKNAKKTYDKNKKCLKPSLTKILSSIKL